MVSLTEWPEVESVVREHRLELVLKNIDGKQRHPNINDEEFQNAIFSKNCMLNFLSLTACNLSQIFPSISNCSSLTKLVVDRNILKEIPDSVGSLCKLTFIDLSCNELTTLPSSFSDLIKLETIIISGNKLTNSGLFDFSSLEMLHILDLSYNKLTDIPQSLTSNKLVKLHTVNFSHNKISEIISSLSLLENLKNLNLSNNELHLLPSPIEKLERIKVLDLSQNPFKDGRFRKLANDKRARVSAIITYLVKNVPKSLNSDGTSEAKENVSKDVAHVDLIEICIGISEYSVKRLNSVVPIRPHLVCCVVKNLDFSGDNFKKFISIQTKLHSSICGNRTVAAIGTHEMNSIQPPLTYLALPADELHITALHKKTPVSARELIDALVRDAELARKRTKRNTLNPLHRYLHLVKDSSSLPCLIDSSGLVISLSPITNSDLTKMSASTHSVWVEVSSADSMQICKEVMNAFIQEIFIICPTIQINQVRVRSENDDLLSVYPDINDLPKLSVRRVYVS